MFVVSTIGTLPAPTSQLIFPSEQASYTTRVRWDANHMRRYALPWEQVCGTTSARGKQHGDRSETPSAHVVLR